MRRCIVLSTTASGDLDDIAEYTLRQWGPDQAERYLAELQTTINDLAEAAERHGRALDTLRKGLRFVRHKDHYFIFYRIMGEEVVVIRILHQRRDWPRLVQAASEDDGAAQ